MKKGYKVGSIVVAVLFTAALYFVTLHKVMPNLENTISATDITANGTFLAAENGTFYNFIYEVDAEGEIVNLFCKQNHFWNRQEQIVDISYSDSEDKVYMLCQQSAGDDQTEYKVYRLSSRWEKAENLGSISQEDTFAVKDFNLVDDVVYVTGLDTGEEKLLVYQLDTEQSEEMELLMERGTTEDGESGRNIHWVSAAFSGKTLYGLSNRGQLYEYNQDNMSPFSLREMGEVTWMCGNHNDIIYYDYMEEVFASIENTPFLELLEGQQGVLAVSYAKETGDSIVVKRNEAGNKDITIYMGDEEFYINEISLGIAAYLTRVITLALIFVVAFVCILLLVLVFWRLIHKVMKRPVLITGIILENILLAAIICVLFYQVGTKHVLESYGISAGTYLAEEQMKCSQLLAEYTEIIPEEFSESQWFEPMKELLSDWSAQEEQGTVSYQIDMVEYQGEESYILYSNENSYGRNIYGIYDKELLEKLEEIKNGDGKGTVYIKDKTGRSVYAVEFLEENDNNCLLWVAKMQIQQAK